MVMNLYHQGGNPGIYPEEIKASESDHHKYKTKQRGKVSMKLKCGAI